jgi:hypothetical protein
MGFNSAFEWLTIQLSFKCGIQYSEKYTEQLILIKTCQQGRIIFVKYYNKMDIKINKME